MDKLYFIIQNQFNKLEVIWENAECKMQNAEFWNCVAILTEGEIVYCSLNLSLSLLRRQLPRQREPKNMQPQHPDKL